MQQPPRRFGQRLDLPPEAVLDPPGQRDRAAEPEPARQLRRGQPAGQFEQGQRVAVRVGDDLLPDPRVQRAGQRRVQQHPRVALGQPADGQLRQARHVLARDPRREHQAYRVGGQPPGGDAQCLRRGLVQPLLVIDHADQRAVAGRLGEQAEHGQADQEPVRRRAGAQAERGPQRLVLRHRQALGAIQQRGAQLVQPGEGQLHLRLHAGRAGHPAPAARPARYSSRTVLPTPGSPRTTRARPSPPRTPSTNRSRTRRSVCRSVSSGARRPGRA